MASSLESNPDLHIDGRRVLSSLANFPFCFNVLNIRFSLLISKYSQFITDLEIFFHKISSSPQSPTVFWNLSKTLLSKVRD